ncbi:VOC family protein [Moorena producens JHB]|uniref:VOC family protein n=1 Tax=Moorena producens (strain JHB) TaxID=1454205 RepID=A0A1D9FX07_MOOP1|nr:VOC family protein [Moorena producens]AOY79863.2 VOC family protein [Moorena producens JHB]
MMQKLLQKLKTATVIALISVFVLLSSGWTSTAVAQSPMDQLVTGYVSKVNVADLDHAIDFYHGILGMEWDTSQDTDRWTQFFYPNLPGTKIGVYEGQPTGTGEAALTLVVEDIEGARDFLMFQGIEVSPIQDVGGGVLLAFFKDFDGNSLTLRQQG